MTHILRSASLVRGRGRGRLRLRLRLRLRHRVRALALAVLLTLTKARLEQRAQEAEASNVRLVEESSALRASLETAHRLSEEKLNGEIR